MAISFTVRSAKSNFFDRDKVIKAMDRAEHRVFSRFGAHVRTGAQTLMLGHKVSGKFGVKSKVKNREGVSFPGQPPVPHTGDLVKFIFFAYEAERHTVVTGPIKLFKDYPDGDGKPVGATVPEVLERGGSIVVREFEVNGEWVRWASRRQKRTAQVRHRTVRIKARPAMQPAFDEELRKLPPMWRNSIR